MNTKTLKLYKERLLKKAETLGLTISYIKYLVRDNRGVEDDEYLLKIALGLAASSRYKFSEKNFSYGVEILKSVKVALVSQNIDIQQLKSAIKDGSIDTSTYLHTEERRLIKDAVEILTGENVGAPC